MFTRQGRRTDPHGHSHSVELNEAASPYRHPRYDRPSAKEKLIPFLPSAAPGRLLPDLPELPDLDRQEALTSGKFQAAYDNSDRRVGTDRVAICGAPALRRLLEERALS